MINTFCEAIGVSRHGNETLVSSKKLEFYARKELDTTAPRTFAVLDPIRVEITNFKDVKTKKSTVPLFPGFPEKGEQTYNLTNTIFVERSDFSEEKKAGFRGITAGQEVLLMQGPVVVLEDVVKGADGSVESIKVKAVVDFDGKTPKGVIQWVSEKNSLEAKVNLYSQLLTVEDVASVSKKEGKEFTAYFNKDSLVVKPNARIWNLHAKCEPYDKFQFVRTGYFSVSEKSKSAEEDGKIVFNLVVALKEDSTKAKNTK